MSSSATGSNGHEIAMMLGKLDAKLDGLSGEIKDVKVDVSGQIKDLKTDIQKLREDVNEDLGQVESRLNALERDLSSRASLPEDVKFLKADLAQLKELVSETKGGLKAAKIIFGVAGAIPTALLVWFLGFVTPDANHAQKAPVAVTQGQNRG